MQLLVVNVGSAVPALGGTGGGGTGGGTGVAIVSLSNPGLKELQ